MAMLKQIEIRGYRSIKEATLDLSSLNVLIGANGAGKSNFISFFKMLNEMMAGRLQAFIGTAGRAQAVLYFGPKATPQLEAKLEFQTDNGTDTYYMRLFHAAGDTLVFAEETLSFQPTPWTGPSRRPVALGAGHQETRIADKAAEGEPIAKVFRHLLNQCRVYHFHDTSSSARSRQSSYLNDNRWLMPDAGNLAAMLYAYRQGKEMVYYRIVSAIRKIMPEFHDFDLEPDRLNQNRILLNWRKRGWDYLFGPDQISDGTLRAISLCALLLQPEDDLPDVIILDEPELGLHPHALEIVAGLIRAASVRTQVIVATQSQSFLNFFEPSEIVAVECRNGETRFQRLVATQLEDWLQDYSIGELWQRNVLGAGPLP